MQSSAAVVGRALIMLACVVGIPALAMSNASWPDIVKKLQNFRWPAILDPASASTATPVALPIASEAPRLASSNPSTTLAETPVRQGHSTQPSPQPPDAAVVPASYQGPIGKNGSNAALFDADPFRSIRSRLQELGATYYLLESWGNQQQMYRFYCKMAVGGNANYTHYFEATEPDPLRAMTQVLRQVEAWRGDSSRQ